ncbi:sensor histidine kinase [Aureibacter tunicatorum]|uniref:Sensor histidine kinase YesM n=1 Tax=Aureibacter tunicatorum TaxID=866807 RepID=A0AAE3XNC3_9BACT|nr:histidine kinase [Aureibacter tunicatorum]MDR6239675.1 sensor histidine kinase YesM [Aureibacter tunicatorum]BDD04151.1 histidine kinase [Aureibacter tunicatorum]
MALEQLKNLSNDNSKSGGTISFVRHVFQNRFLQHVAFWLWVYFFGLVVSTSLQEREVPFDLQLIRNMSNLILSIPLTYFNLYWLIPRYLDKKKYLMYALLAILSLLVTASLTYYIIIQTHESYFFNFFYRNIYVKGYAKGTLLLTYRYLSICLLTTLLHFIRRTIKIQEKALEYEEVQKEKYQVELSALKAQINPHFLFNALNSVYCLSLEESKRTPEIILKISNLISYVLYSCEDERVVIQKEVDFLSDYITIETIRVDESTSVSFDHTGDLKGHKIAPLLLLPIVENAFKHGSANEKGEAFVNINLHVDEDSFHLKVENSYEQQDTGENPNSGGIGLVNVRRRLELIYPEKHNLQIVSDGNIFKLELTIEL